jgi:hypothetical protein
VKSVLKIGLFLILLSTTGCWRQMHQDKVAEPHQVVNPAVDAEEFYQEIRSRWTIRLSPGSIHAGESYASPFSRRVRREEGGDSFPLMIRATLMVDEVIDAGLLYYKQMAEMSAQQADSFSQNYRAGNQMDRYLLIELSLQTFAAENYLNLRRYTIYIEDDQHNKLEPAKIVERPMGISSRRGMMYGTGREQEPPGSVDWTQHQKSVFLYFAKKDLNAQPTLQTGLRELKIVFILQEGGSGRVEGKWIFPD